MAGLDDLIQQPDTYTGEKNHHVELAGKQARREVKCLGIVLERNFAHGRGDKMFAAPCANQLLDLGGTPTFEG